MQGSLRTFFLTAALAAAGPAAAQLIGGGLPGGLPRLPDSGETVRGAAPDLRGLARNELLRPVDALAEAARSTRVLGRDRLRRNPRLLEADEAGRPVVRGEVTALGPSAAALDAAQAAGFAVKRREPIPELGLEVVVLSPPAGASARDALRKLRALDPRGQYDFNHIYFESGAAPDSSGGPATSTVASGRGLRIGLVDGSVDAGALPGAQVVQRAFGPGGAKMSAHATAVASLMAGETAGFRGAAPGATVYVADIYGPTAAGGSATAVARGLGWLAESRVGVINISLVGPPNAVLSAAIESLVRRGHVVVAAVGNDGPAAPPLYPAAYTDVIGVTGVDARRRVLPEAGRGPQVDFAAPGGGLAAVGPRGEFVPVRGTSYAAPLVAGLAARLSPEPAVGASTRVATELGRRATDLGPAGPDPVFGRGGLALDLATTPAALASKRRR